MTVETIEQTLAYEEHSAEFWSQRLGGWSAMMRNRADGYALAAAVISVITGAAVWTTLAESAEVWSQLLVTAMAIAAAVAASMPKLRGYGDCSTKAAELAGKYGEVLVALRFANEHRKSGAKGAEAEVRAAIGEFQKARIEKEKLSPYPSRLAKEVSQDYATMGIGHP